MGQENNSTTAMKWEQLIEKERYKIEGLFELGLTPAHFKESFQTLLPDLLVGCRQTVYLERD